MQVWEEVQTWRGQIDPSGRLLIPAESRAAMGWERGTDVVLESDGDSLRVISLEQFTREVQAMFGRDEMQEQMKAEEQAVPRQHKSLR